MTPNEMAREIRRLIIEISYKANVGHIGSCLSVANILAALYADDGGILDLPFEGGYYYRCNGCGYSFATPDEDDDLCYTCSPRDSNYKLSNDRDRFIISCGHKALTVYAALFLRGFITRDELDTYCQPGSRLYTHPNHEVPGVEYSTGSLGMGLSYACGEALAAKMQGSKRKVYCLCSDGELQEGSLWEAIMFAAHHKLDNLICIVDANGQQALGKTADICDLNKPVTALGVNFTSLRAKFVAFGWNWAECVSPMAVTSALGTALRVSKDAGTPAVVIVPTVFGDGVSFMETGGVSWHYLPLNEEQYAQALVEVTA